MNVISGGLIVLGNGVDTGRFNVAANTTLTFSAGSDTFSNATVAGAGTFIVNGNETITALGNVSIGSANFTFDSSTLTGSGTVTVNSAMTWTNGSTMAERVSPIYWAVQPPLSISLFSIRTLNNFGTFTQSNNVTFS